MSEHRDFRPTGWSSRKMKAESRWAVVVFAVLLVLGILYWAVRGGRAESPGAGTIMDPAAVAPSTPAEQDGVAGRP